MAAAAATSGTSHNDHDLMIDPSSTSMPPRRHQVLLAAITIRHPRARVVTALDLAVPAPDW
ncbi:hypothetical protein [Pseudonocardia sp. MH-G8]|uniref:hypothetical protein n=1 Tax=Pseudonocardia sp. MH-G8 TaxID=1854588 RepID=UPI00117B7B0F|nr:hypothetical protein [Pseudonocardia sp. MH-G8]